MPRRAKSHGKSVKQQINDSHRYCRYCNANCDKRGFEKHQTACKTIWEIQHHRQQNPERILSLETHIGEEIRSSDGINVSPLSPVNPIILTSFLKNEPKFNNVDISIPECFDARDLASTSQMTTLETTGEHEYGPYGPHLPDTYIKIIPHPHSINTEATIVPLVSNNTSSPSSRAEKTFVPAPESRPWAPFRTLADFEYTETAVTGMLSGDLVNKQLAGFNDKWSIGGTHLTIRTYKDMQESLGKAREYGIQVSRSMQDPLLQTITESHQFKQAKVSAIYRGEPLEFEFQYHDPWEYILNLIQDKSLASVSCWNSVRKIYCCGLDEERIIDEPNTADAWWEVDVSHN